MSKFRNMGKKLTNKNYTKNTFVSHILENLVSFIKERTQVTVREKCAEEGIWAQGGRGKAGLDKTRYLLHISSTNIRTEYFKHAA
jgi:hypothetical protein